MTTRGCRSVRAAKFVWTRSGTRRREGAVGLAMRFLRGIAVYVSGQIAKLAPDSIRLETPSAIVGVRGTSLAVSVVPE